MSTSVASNPESIERKEGSQRIAERKTLAPRIKKKRHRKEKALAILLSPVVKNCGSNTTVVGQG